MSAGSWAGLSKHKVPDDLNPVDGIAVVDGKGGVYCVVFKQDCAGKDLSAAKARASLIAETLNAHAPPYPYQKEPPK